MVAKGKKLVKDLANSEDLCSKARSTYVSARKTQQKSDETYKALKVKGDQKKIEKVSSFFLSFFYFDILFFEILL